MTKKNDRMTECLLHHHVLHLTYLSSAATWQMPKISLARTEDIIPLRRVSNIPWSTYDMTWHDMTWHDMTWHDMTWHVTLSYTDLNYHNHHLSLRNLTSTSIRVALSCIAYHNWSKLLYPYLQSHRQSACTISLISFLLLCLPTDCQSSYLCLLSSLSYRSRYKLCHVRTADSWSMLAPAWISLSITS